VNLSDLAGAHVLGALLERLKDGFGGYEIIAHWTQGEFHHDMVVRVERAHELPGDVLVVSTNCNGGIKELLCFASVPNRSALWHARCPAEPEFTGELPRILGRETTMHWFDPCELLHPNARSELKPEHRRRQLGGGWEKR
jgi:hypothetical protein